MAAQNLLLMGTPLKCTHLQTLDVSGQAVLDDYFTGMRTPDKSLCDNKRVQ